jgi:hypothetical protein
MLDTWQPGRKQRIRTNHILAAERIRREFTSLPPQAFHDDPVTTDQRSLMQRLEFHKTQIEMWGKSIAEFGDEPE